MAVSLKRLSHCKSNLHHLVRILLSPFHRDGKNNATHMTHRTVDCLHVIDNVSQLFPLPPPSFFVFLLFNYALPILPNLPTPFRCRCCLCSPPPPTAPLSLFGLNPASHFSFLFTVIMSAKLFSHSVFLHLPSPTSPVTAQARSNSTSSNPSTVTLSSSAQQCLSQFTLNAPSNPSGYPCSTCLPILVAVPLNFS